MARKTKLCPRCKMEIDKRASKCPYCKSKIGISARDCFGSIILIVFVIVIIFWIIPQFMKGFNNSAGSTSSYSESDYKSMCRAVSFDEIARDKNALEGQYLTFSGEIIQEIQDNYYRLSITDNSDYIIIHYDDSRLLVGDTVTVWGKSTGFTEGKTILGLNAKSPQIEVVYTKIKQ